MSCWRCNVTPYQSCSVNACKQWTYSVVSIQYRGEAMNSSTNLIRTPCRQGGYSSSSSLLHCSSYFLYLYLSSIHSTYYPLVSYFQFLWNERALRGPFSRSLFLPSLFLPSLLPYRVCIFYSSCDSTIPQHHTSTSTSCSHCSYISHLHLL